MSSFTQRLALTSIIVSLGLSQTSCAYWFQEQKSSAAPSISESTPVITSLSYLESFINSDQASEMLNTEPLKTRVNKLTKRHTESFTASRQTVKPVTQIMQGYIFSEGQSSDGNLVSLVLIDPERDALMVVITDKAKRKINVLADLVTDSSDEAATEMEAYAEQWAQGQLGQAK